MQVAEEAATLSCKLCNATLSSEQDLWAHLQSSEHAQRIPPLTGGCSGTNLRCNVCKNSFLSQAHMDQHMTGSKHKLRLLQKEVQQSHNVYANKGGIIVSQLDEVTSLVPHHTVQLVSRV